MVLWDTSPSSSQSAGFPNKVAIPCPDTSSPDLLACREASSMSLDLVTLVQPAPFPCPPPHTTGAPDLLSILHLRLPSLLFLPLQDSSQPTLPASVTSPMASTSPTTLVVTSRFQVLLRTQKFPLGGSIGCLCCVMTKAESVSLPEFFSPSSVNDTSMEPTAQARNCELHFTLCSPSSPTGNQSGSSDHPMTRVRYPSSSQPHCCCQRQSPYYSVPGLSQ